MRFILPLVVASLIALTAGCATSPSGTTPPAAPTPAEAAARQPAANPATKAAATKANLAIEKLRLSELFKGTPVVFALQPDGSLRVDVPLNFSFDAGKSAVKAPLAAVLDRVAAGQANETTQLVVRAPADAGSTNTALIGERAASARDRLVARGLAGARVTTAGTPGAPVVRIVVTDAPAP